ncbi:ribonuclease HII [bacterium]|nr:ribonuclease HII [bacterium]
MRAQYVVGIDEAGRGPVAGPLVVGAVLARVETPIEHEYFAKGIRDSKKLTVGKRENLFSWIRKNDELRHVVSMVGPRVVDREGIAAATATAISRALRRVIPGECGKEEVLVLLDGGLRAPAAFINQATIIRGDEKEPLIALASVVAKVSRDHKMRTLSFQHPEYGFDGHKGYGTREHYKAIRRFGLCDSHRKSFLTRIS